MSDNIEPIVRNAVRALIFKNEKVLVQKKIDGSYTLPGGAPNFDETLTQGLLRECKEEIGTTVEVKQLIHVADYFKPRKSQISTIRHQVEFIFLCSVNDDYIAHNGDKPDKRQVDVLWLELKSLSQVQLFPVDLIPVIINANNIQNSTQNALCYLGTLNHE